MKLNIMMIKNKTIRRSVIVLLTPILLPVFSVLVFILNIVDAIAITRKDILQAAIAMYDSWE